MNRNVLFFALILLLVPGCVDDRDSFAKERISNSEKIKIGMSSMEVVEIMGEPDTVVFFRTPDCCPTYLYEIHDDSFGAGEIRFDSSKRVARVVFPRKD